MSVLALTNLICPSLSVPMLPLRKSSNAISWYVFFFLSILYVKCKLDKLLLTSPCLSVQVTVNPLTHVKYVYRRHWGVIVAVFNSLSFRLNKPEHIYTSTWNPPILNHTKPWNYLEGGLSHLCRKEMKERRGKKWKREGERNEREKGKAWICSQW